MKTNIIIGQSGGPTPVINMTLRGVVEEAYHAESIDQIYGMRHGLEGILGKGMISLHEKMEAVTKWSEQPGAILGGSRYAPDETDFERFCVFLKKRISGFFVILGETVLPVQ
ncbi:6-phosphofructokinase [Ectobacillus funiculus]